MNLSQSRLSLLVNLANNGGGILWGNIGGVGKTASMYLTANGLTEIIEPAGNTYQPALRRLQITAAGMAAIGRATTQSTQTPETDMADIETAHYGALIRLQVTMSALQNLLGATADENAGDPGQADAIANARDDASAAIEIALGGRHDVPERLMRNWSDNSMKRDAAKALAASAWDPNFI